MPKAIFLISHGLHDKVIQIFYSRNKFAVDTAHQDVFQSIRDSLHNGVLRFLRALPSQALSHIRELDCLFQDLLDDHFEVGTASRANWQAIWDFIATNLTVSQPTLALNNTSPRGHEPTRLAFQLDDEDYRPSREAREQECFQRILDPLVHSAAKPKSLYNFLLGTHIPKYYEQRWAHAHTLERLIMGEAYNSDEDGKHAEDDREYLRIPQERFHSPDDIQP